MSSIVNTLGSLLGVLADASVIQSAATALGAVLVLVPDIHVSPTAVVAALVAVSATAQAVENHFSKAKAAAAS